VTTKSAAGALHLRHERRQVPADSQADEGAGRRGPDHPTHHMTSQQSSHSGRRPSLLFVCTHNAGRSQLAAGLAELMTGGTVAVSSAGTEPDAAVSPEVLASLAELGIDRSDQVPRLVTAKLMAQADVVVSLRPGLSLPGNVDGQVEVWQLPEPHEWTVDGIRPLREHLRRRLELLLSDLSRG
jgi:arsenate reductase